MRTARWLAATPAMQAANKAQGMARSRQGLGRWRNQWPINGEMAALTGQRHHSPCRTCMQAAQHGSTPCHVAARGETAYKPLRMPACARSSCKAGNRLANATGASALAPIIRHFHQALSTFISRFHQALFVPLHTRRCLMRNAALFSKNRRAIARHGGLSLADWRRNNRQTGSTTSDMTSKGLTPRPQKGRARLYCQLLIMWC